MTDRSSTIADEPSSKKRRIGHGLQVKQENNGDNTMPYRDDDYTIGWVCALPKEQTAARAMLDQEHPELPSPARDDNAYILGSVGRHNVVITCLPVGTVGTVAAAQTTANLKATFGGLRFLLMVGIGGGVPLGPDGDGDAADVRLGDVVVGAPTGRLPAVVQWDVGEVGDGGFRRTGGAVNGPPRFLLTRLAVLQTEHEMRGSRIPEYLEAMATKWPRLREKYCKSSSLRDVLFEANYSHVATPPSSTPAVPNDTKPPPSQGCRHCDPRRVVQREPREMKVHYGTVASGNQVVKSAAFRDQVNRDLGGGVLCFEMEAAGAAALLDFPCLVIRGICDYCDSHKSKEWQEHAAAVAAAFAVELLSHVPPAPELDRELDAWEKVQNMRLT